MRSKLVLSALAGLLLVAGCGGDDTTTVTVRETVTQTVTGTVPKETPTLLAVFFLHDDGKVQATGRMVLAGPAVARTAIVELLKGPQAVEQQPGLAAETAIPAGTELRALSVADGVADIELSQGLSRPAQAQVVYTLTQFPTIQRVRFLSDGEPRAPARGRRAYETQTPAILVLSPLPGESVESPFEVSGTANTFEATFQYELQDANGSVLTKDFVTATSGSGTRGTFRFPVRYDVPPQYGSLAVFEISAEDGSRTNERSIPLSLR
jgi:germination protein M